MQQTVSVCTPAHAQQNRRRRGWSAVMMMIALAVTAILSTSCGDQPKADTVSTPSATTTTTTNTTPVQSTTAIADDALSLPPSSAPTPQDVPAAPAPAPPNDAPQDPPAVQAPTSDERCTNQINYAGDPRSNAEINSIGEQTGQCPAPITG
nr:hypothetical protein [Rhodococcus sp. (in: high G+C Gram-positive bacteria)]